MRAHLPWRILVPIILIMGLGLTLASGIYFLKVENSRWHNQLEFFAAKHMMEIDHIWQHLDAK